jgi:hypothetical protein
MRGFAALLLCLCVLTPGALFGQGYVEGFFGSTSVDLPGDFTFDDETAFGFWGGYAFSDNFSVEAGYGNYGDFSVFIDDGFDGYTESIEVSSFNVGIKGLIPLDSGVYLQGKVGMALWEASTTFSDGFPGYKDDGNDLYFGFGASYLFSDTTYATVDYLMAEFDDDQDVSVVSMGIGMLF